MDCRTIPRLLISPLFALVLTGCGIGPASLPAPTNGPALQGTVFGGSQPISGATVQLFAVGLIGNGSAATDILTGPHGSAPLAYATTNGSGGFSIFGDYACPANPATPVYLTATGGNPGLSGNATNTYIALVAALGPCNQLSSTQHITLNEATTVAAAWALAPFATSLTSIGASSTNLIGITNAFATANQLVDTSIGASPNATVAAYTVIESAKLYSLADILASCVNSDGSPCPGLFSDANNGISTDAPTDTFAAALDVVQNPGRGVAALFNNHMPATPPFPGLAKAPNDWSISITYRTDTGPLLNFALTAFDSVGNLWGYGDGEGYSQSTIVKLSRQLAPLASIPLIPASDGNDYGGPSFTIDSSDNIWVINSSVTTKSGSILVDTGTVLEFNSSGVVISGFPGYTSGGLADPELVAADANGYVWVGNDGSYDDNQGSVYNVGGGITLYPASGTSPSPSNGYANSMLFFPNSATFDGHHTAWFTNLDTGNLVSIAPPTTLNPQPTINYVNIANSNNTLAIAADTANNIWFTVAPAGSPYGPDTLGWVSSTGTLISSSLTGSGFTAGYYMLIDPSNRIWVENSDTSYAIAGVNPLYTFCPPVSLSVFAGGTGQGAPLSPVALGKDATTCASPTTQMLSDTSGDLWIPNATNDANYDPTTNSGITTPGIIMFVGLATPAKTPLLGIPQAP